MTEEKICPIMSRPYISCISGKDEFGTRTQYTDVEYVECQKERCMAWDEQKYLDKPGRCRLIP